MAEYTPTTEEITPERAGALLAAAVQGVAWALIEYETDTSDRGVSEEHYRDAVRRAGEILPTLLPTVVTEEPEWGTALRTPRGELWDFESETNRENAEAHVWACNHDDHMPDVCLVVSRTPGREAGPWVPVEQGDET